MTRDQAKAYLKSSGFSDLQISEIERAFIVDFVFNSSMGAKCVELLLEGKANRIVRVNKGEIDDIDINEGLEMKKEIPQELLDLAKKLTV